MAEQTLFERILSGEIPSHEIDSGDGWYAFLDIFPRREGHTLVIPTAPVQRIADLSEEQRTMLMNGVVAVQKRLSNHFNTTDFTVVVHDGPLAGQEVPHVHFHVIPRYEGKRMDRPGQMVKDLSILSLQANKIKAELGSG